ncbi:MAG: hypothetical protein K2X77_31480 [Candidatus Obscuribacterales bacterium]|nr:hypothetical protein [Candidatus Obscuribacterales bacterium]
MTTQPIAFLFSIAITILCSALAPSISFASPAVGKSPAQTIRSMSEGKSIERSITAGPFLIDRKYKSMEGPYVDLHLTVGDITDGGNVIADEKFVTFTDRPMTALPPQFQGKTASQQRTLYWLKGIKIDVLGENDKVLPTTEFVCHMNLDIDRKFRAAAFPEAEPSETERLICLTQGLDSIVFPEGFGVPVASDEPWRIIMQAANRTSSVTNLVKHKLTFYFIKDNELIRPLKALTWSVPYLTVVVDRDTREAQDADKTKHPHCGLISSGLTAPNAGDGGVWTDALGRKVSGHWVVPPGKHNYANPVNVADFAKKDRKIHLAWAHIHPLCTKFALKECGESKNIFSGKVVTSTKNGLLIEKMDYISDPKGIALKGGKNYQLEATYENTTDEAQDSMVSCGIFFADDNFARPEWALQKRQAAHCEMRPSGVCTNLKSTNNTASVELK